MCGLTGFARHPHQGAPLATLVPIFEALMKRNESRGGHATGFAVQQPDGATVIWKRALTASAALKSDAWSATLAALPAQSQAIIGHTRYATVNNAHLDAAAHPFQEGAIVGAHNGIIRNWEALKGQDDAWIVDSQAAFALLDRHPHPNDALKQLTGYFALTWFKKRGLYIVRSESASLVMAYVHAWKTLFWSSEEAALKAALTAAKAPYFDCWTPTTGTLYRYAPAEFGAKKTNVRSTVLTLATSTARNVNTARPSFRDFADDDQSRWGWSQRLPGARGVGGAPVDPQQHPLFKSRPDLAPLVDALGRPIDRPLGPTATLLATLTERLTRLESAVGDLSATIDLEHGRIEALQVENEFLWTVLRDAGLLEGRDLDGPVVAVAPVGAATAPY